MRRKWGVKNDDIDPWVLLLEENSKRESILNELIFFPPEGVLVLSLVSGHLLGNR